LPKGTSFLWRCEVMQVVRGGDLVDQIDTEARESQISCWQHGLDRLAHRVEQPS
jgi:hypothetical protein